MHTLYKGVMQMPKKQPPYRLIAKPPEGYKLPDVFWDMMIKKAIEAARNETPAK